jgi:anti-sigma B factor antagonist
MGHITPCPLSVSETSEGGVHRLTPIGELDLATAPVLESAFEAALRDHDAEMIVVDLTELSFIDSSGIHLLIRMHGACADLDRLRVINGSRPVERLLDLTGVRAHLPIISRDCDPLAPLPKEAPNPSSRVSPRTPQTGATRPAGKP